jgi:hypothetical protein
MQTKYDAQALVASNIIPMIFKYYSQIYLIIYLFIRKTKTKIPCCYIILMMEF